MLKERRNQGTIPLLVITFILKESLMFIVNLTYIKLLDTVEKFLEK